MKREAFMLPLARCARTIFPVVLKKKAIYLPRIVAATPQFFVVIALGLNIV